MFPGLVVPILPCIIAIRCCVIFQSHRFMLGPGFTCLPSPLRDQCSNGLCLPCESYCPGLIFIVCNCEKDWPGVEQAIRIRSAMVIFLIIDRRHLNDNLCTCSSSILTFQVNDLDWRFATIGFLQHRNPVTSNSQPHRFVFGG